MDTEVRCFDRQFHGRHRRDKSGSRTVGNTVSFGLQRYQFLWISSHTFAARGRKWLSDFFWADVRTLLSRVVGYILGGSELVGVRTCRNTNTRESHERSKINMGGCNCGRQTSFIRKKILFADLRIVLISSSRPDAEACFMQDKIFFSSCCNSNFLERRTIVLSTALHRIKFNRIYIFV